MDYWGKDIYSWDIFSAEVYPCSSIAIQRTARMSWISCPLNDLQKGQQVHSLQVHRSAQPGSPYPSMASLGHSGSRTTTSSLWQSTPSGMSRCLASSGQHLIDGEGSSGPSSGSSRMVLPPTPQRNHWHGYGSVSLTDWSAPGVTRSGRHIHRIWTPQIFNCGDTLRTGCLATTSRPYLTWRQQSQRSRGRNAGGSSRTLPTGSKSACSAGELIWSTFSSASETKSFCSTDLKL